MNKSTEEKTPRERSAPYPAVPISESLKFIRLIDSLGSKTVSYASILEPMGLKSSTTRSFLSRISASKQFGLITTGGNTAHLTDSAQRILYPNLGESEVRQLLLEAFCKPQLYAKLIARFTGKALPAKEQLANILMNEYRIIKQVKDNAASCFIESAEFLGLLKNGVLCMDMPKMGVEHAASLGDTESMVTPDADDAPLPMSESKVASEGYNFEIPTLGKKTARFYIPDDVTKKDLDYIKLYIENMLPVFLDNLKSELQ